MSMSWLKLHHDILSDIKLRKFNAQEKWAWVVLLILASENSDRGKIAADDEGILPTLASFHLKMTGSIIVTNSSQKA